MKKFRLLAALLALLLLGGCAGTEPDAALTPDGDPAGQEEAVTTKLVYTGGTTTLRLELDQETGLWHWGDDRDFPLDQDFALSLLEVVDGIRELTPIARPGELADYDLDEPNRTLTVTDSRGETLTYQLGKWNDAGVHLYREDKPGEIYAVKGLRNRLDSRVFDLMELPELPQLTAKNMISVELSSDRGTLLLTPSEEGRWLLEGRDVTEQVADFTRWLEEMCLTACLDWRPSSGVPALCGLDEPMAELTVLYAPAGGERSFRLTVGWLRDEGRCVRLADDDTIYLMDGDAMAPLMRLAKNGLD